MTDLRREINLILRQHIDDAAERLTNIQRERFASLRAFPREVTLDHYLSLGYAALPICKMIENQEPVTDQQDIDDGYIKLVRFLISSPEQASCLGVFIGNDTNSAKHLGEHGTTQSNAIIGICTDAVMRVLGLRLTLVAPLNFRKAIPIGSDVIVTIKVKSSTPKRGMGDIFVNFPDGGEVMRKAKLMVVEDPSCL